MSEVIVPRGRRFVPAEPLGVQRYDPCYSQAASVHVKLRWKSSLEGCALYPACQVEGGPVLRLRVRLAPPAHT